MKTKTASRIKYILYLLVITVLCLEFSPYLISPLLYSTSFSRSDTKVEIIDQYKVLNAKNGNVEEESVDGYLGDHILHPYLGFTGIPEESKNQFCFDGPDPISKRTEKSNVTASFLFISERKDYYIIRIKNL